MSLEQHKREYRRSEAAVFRKTRETWGGLSNMAPGFPIEVNGVEIRTSEALYQACRFPHYPEIQRLIIDQRSPMTAKMRSKPYREDSCRSDWDKVRLNIMRWCLRVKLAQNWDSFGTLLCATGSTEIVEEKRNDDFWGAKNIGDGFLLGTNALGRLLMELRAELMGPTADELRFAAPLRIPDFLLLGTPIREVGPRKSENVPAPPTAHQPRLNLDLFNGS